MIDQSGKSMAHEVESFQPNGVKAILSIWLLIGLLHMTSVSSDVSFVLTKRSENVVLCSVDTPSEEIQISQSTTCTIPFSVRCGWQCKKSPNCTNFNIKNDSNSCELYSYSPTNYSEVPGCSHFEVKLMWHWISSYKMQRVFWRHGKLGI